MFQTVGGKPVAEQRLGIFKPLGGGGVLHDDGDQLHTIPLRRSREAVESGVRGAGLESGGPVEEPDELVGIHQFRSPIPKGIHPDGGILADVRMVQYQLPAHQGDVIGGGDMALGGKACGIFKSGVVHPQLLGPLVHPLHKGVLTAGDLFRQRHGAVVGGDHTHRLEHVGDSHLLVFLQPDLAAAHGTGVGGGGDHRVVAQLSGVDGLHGQKNGHDFGDAGRLQLGVLIFGKEDRTGLLFHQQGRRRRHLHSPGTGGQHQHRPQQRDDFFHGEPPFPRWYHCMSGGGHSCRAVNFRVAFCKRLCYNGLRLPGLRP